MNQDLFSLVYGRTQAERLRERSCYAKKQFLSELNARKANKGQRPYHCNVCGMWHLTTKARTARGE